MPRKVLLYGDALKLLYTFVDYAQSDSGLLANALNYDYSCFKQRARALDQQLKDGLSISFDDLDDEIEEQKRINNDM